MFILNIFVCYVASGIPPFAGFAFLFSLLLRHADAWAQCAHARKRPQSYYFFCTYQNFLVTLQRFYTEKTNIYVFSLYFFSFYG